MDFKILSKYDDLCASLFLDDQYLWFDTIKMNDEQVRSDTPFNVIQQIIYEYVIEQRKVTHAAKALLSLPFFQLYLEDKNDKERQEFAAHVKRYLLMYIPNAGFEISDTDRYSGIEACVISTRTWEIADEIKNCTGMIACLSPEDDAELKKSNRDFSIMYSQRRDSNCLFLGPARFMNHDCGANCRFIGLGTNGITFKVVKHIDIGEELTVFYGPHYFGIDNCECRCLTCEMNGRGYFASALPEKDDPPPKPDDRSTGRRSGRKKRSRAYEEYVLHTGDRRVKLSTATAPVSTKKIKKEKLKQHPIIDHPILSPSASNDSGLASKTTSVSDGSPQPVLTPSTATSYTLEPSLNNSQSLVCVDVSNNGYLPSKGDTKNEMQLDTAMNGLIISTDRAGETQLTTYDKTVSTPTTMIDDILRTKSTAMELYAGEDENTVPRLDDLQNPEWLQIMDAFLDDVSDLSSIASDDLGLIEDSISDTCIACERSLYAQSVQRYTRSDSPHSTQQYQQLRRHAHNRCWRCSRHFLIYQIEWPARRPKIVPSSKGTASGNRTKIMD